MALWIPGKTQCLLCQEVIVDRDTVSTTHFIVDRSDPLWPYSDAVIHAVRRGLSLLHWTRRGPGLRMQRVRYRLIPGVW